VALRNAYTTPNMIHACMDTCDAMVIAHAARAPLWLKRRFGIAGAGRREYQRHGHHPGIGAGQGVFA